MEIWELALFILCWASVWYCGVKVLANINEMKLCSCLSPMCISFYPFIYEATCEWDSRIIVLFDLMQISLVLSSISDDKHCYRSSKFFWLCIWYLIQVIISLCMEVFCMQCFYELCCYKIHKYPILSFVKCK